MARTKAFDRTVALERAKDLFWCKGYEAASIQELTEAMGIGRGSLYETYRSKHALFLEALRLSREQNRLDAGRLLDEECAPRDIIVGIFARVVDDAVDDPGRRGCMIVNAITELAAHDRLVEVEAREAVEHVETGLTWLVEEGQRRGEFRLDLDPLTTARFLANSINGMRVTGKARPDRAALEGVASLALSVLG